MSTTPSTGPRPAARAACWRSSSRPAGYSRRSTGGAPPPRPSAAERREPRRKRAARAGLRAFACATSRSPTRSASSSDAPASRSPTAQASSHGSARSAARATTPPLAQALQQLLADVPFTFRETDGQVIVVPMPRGRRTRQPDARPTPLRWPRPRVTGALGIVMPADPARRCGFGDCHWQSDDRRWHADLGCGRRDSESPPVGDDERSRRLSHCGAARPLRRALRHDSRDSTRLSSRDRAIHARAGSHHGRRHNVIAGRVARAGRRHGHGRQSGATCAGSRRRDDRRVAGREARRR